MKPIVLSAGILAVGIAGSLFLHQRSDQPPLHSDPVHTRTESSNLKHRTKIDSHSHQEPSDIHIGEWQRYSTHLRFAAELGAEGNEMRRMELDIDGLWRATLVSQADAESIYEVTLESPKVGLPEANPDMQRALEGMLAAPHYLVVDSTGRLRHLKVPADTAPSTWRMWFQLASAVQMSAGAGDEYHVEERDAAGEYLAQYVKVDGSRYDKHKLHYLRARAGGSWSERDANALGVDSTLSIVGEPGQFARKVHGKEVSWTEDKMAIVGMRVTTEISMDVVDTGVDSEAADRFAQSNTSLLSSEFAPPGSFVEDAVSAESFADLTTELLDPETRPSSLLLQFASRFRTDPDSVAEAVDWIKSDASKDPTAVIAAALGEAGTEEAQAALIELSGKDVPETYATEAIIELGRTTEPTPEAVATLREASIDTSVQRSSTATLALGNAADQLAGRRAHSSAEIIEDLIARLDAATSEAEVTTLLAALGNTASPAALQAIALRLSEGVQPIRAAAADALRLIPGPETTQLLARALRDDQEPMVRGRAASSLAYHPASLAMSPLSHAAKGDQVVAVRAEAVNSLGTIGPKDPAVREVLAFIAANDQDERVRQSAEALL